MDRTALVIACVAVLAFLLVCILVAYMRPISGT